MRATNLATLAASFIAIGGRLMIDPAGNFLSAIDAGRLFERIWPEPEPPEPFAARRMIASAYKRAERCNPDGLAAMVRQNGSATGNGWLVWRAAA